MAKHTWMPRFPWHEQWEGLKGLTGHPLYPSTARMEGHGTASPAPFTAAYSSLKGSPFHYTDIFPPQLIEPKHNTHPGSGGRSAQDTAATVPSLWALFSFSPCLPQQAMALSGPPPQTPAVNTPSLHPGSASAPKSIFPWKSSQWPALPCSLRTKKKKRKRP